MERTDDGPLVLRGELVADAMDDNEVVLPAELDSFVGRDAEIERGLGLLAAHRLVTLAGPGGVGKTRLATRLGRLAAPRFRDGVVLVGLADVPDDNAGGVRSRLLRALGMADNCDDADAQLGDALRDRELLLVLDNCEHVTGPVRELARTVLAAAPGVRVLATSRTYLEVPGEHLLTVPPLGHDGAVSDSVRLLVERAAARDVVVDPHDPDAARLCDLLDGLPLAIEIAAAHLHLSTLGGIVADLADPLALLGEVVHADQAHHRSLRALMHWSYRLLTPPQRQMWALLSEFRGTIGPDSARDVAARVGISGPDAAGLIAHLVHSSILTRAPHRDRVRLRMLEPVRRYGLGLVLDELSRDAIRSAVADHFTERAAQAARDWYGPREMTLLRELTDDAPSLVAASAYLSEDADRVGQALHLVVDIALARGPIFAGMLREMRDHLVGVLAAYERLRPGECTPTHVTAVALGAWLAFCQGKAEVGGNLLDQARALQARVGGAEVTALRFAEVTGRWLADPDPDRGTAVDFDQVADDARTDGERAMARLFAALAAAFAGQDDAVERARAYLADTEEAGATWAISWAEFAVATAEAQRGDLAVAAAVLRSTVSVQDEMGDSWGLAWSVWLAGVIAARRGQVVEATRIFGAAGRLLRSIGVVFGGLLPWLRVHRTATAVCVADLPDAAIRAHTAEGEALDRRQAVALALSVLDVADTGRERSPGGLTRREQEAADLVALGLTDRQIADRWGVSVRTVENHVANARGKLDAVNRAALAAAWLRLSDPA